jgi:hypothetical protein
MRRPRETRGEGVEAGQGLIPGVRRLGPALQIALQVEPKGWPAAIEAIADPDEKRWADHWLRQQAQILRMRRKQAAPATKTPPGRVDRDRSTRAQREQRRR